MNIKLDVVYGYKEATSQLLHPKQKQQFFIAHIIHMNKLLKITICDSHEENDGSLNRRTGLLLCGIRNVPRTG